MSDCVCTDLAAAVARGLNSDSRKPSSGELRLMAACSIGKMIPVVKGDPYILMSSPSHNV